jgi:hypothetical protein
MTFPMPPGSKELEVKAGVEPEAVSYIMRTTLRPQHHDDPQVLRFISEYIRCRDVAQASSAAGLHVNSGRVLRNKPDINNCINALTEASIHKYGFDAHELIEKVKELAYVDPVEFENEDGTFKTSMRDIPPEARRAIKKFKAKNIYDYDANGIRTVTGQLIEVELYDKKGAIEMLGREKNIFKQTSVVEHDLTSNMKDVLLQSAARAEAAAIEARKNDVNTIDVTPLPIGQSDVKKEA